MVGSYANPPGFSSERQVHGSACYRSVMGIAELPRTVTTPFVFWLMSPVVRTPVISFPFSWPTKLHGLIRKPFGKEFVDCTANVRLPGVPERAPVALSSAP